MNLNFHKTTNSVHRLQCRVSDPENLTPKKEVKFDLNLISICPFLADNLSSSPLSPLP